jgi:DNA-binding transcriptional ArsR family regulator
MNVITTPTSLDALTRFGHALSDPTRVKILVLLSEKSYYPADMSDKLKVTRQSMSNHLACLKGCGLVIQDYEGRRSRYQLANDQIKHALIDLQRMVIKTDPSACAETDEKDCC